MPGNNEKDGEVLVQVRLPREEARELKALAMLREDSMAKLGRLALRDLLRRELSNPDTAEAVKGLMEGTRV